MSNTIMHLCLHIRYVNKRMHLKNSAITYHRKIKNNDYKKLLIRIKEKF